jgi:hypothetical protein
MPASPPITSLKSIQIVATAIMASTIMYTVIGATLVLLRVIPAGGLTPMPEENRRLAGAALCAAGLLAGAASIMVRKRLDTRGPSGSEGQIARFRNAIIAMAIAESPSVLGVVAALLTGDLAVPFVLWGAAIGGCVLHFPTRATLGPR